MVVEDKNYPCARYLRAQFSASASMCLLFTFLWLFYHSSCISLRFFAGIKVARGWEMLKLLVNVGIRVTARKTLQKRISSNEPQRFSGFSDHTVQPFETFSRSLFAVLSCLYSAYLSKLSRHIVLFTVFQVLSASQWRRIFSWRTNKMCNVQS